MAETRVIITAEAQQAIAEFERLRHEATGALGQIGQGSRGLYDMRMSAAQTAAALRQVPAQFTDIVVSLQAGQNPLTVMLQQGGQLRDMFGSAGAAVRAVGGYALSLVTPLTALGAAAAVAAVAYHQGSAEADAYTKSIVMSGNAAGVTTSQLAAMAKQASASAGTQGANAEALAALVATGRVAASELTSASTATLQSQKYLGKAVEETVKEFAELGKAPLEASMRLNEQYGYLTLATYGQVKALEQEGRVSEAARIAQEAYASAMKEKSAQVAASLGTLQRAWNATGSAAKGAWDYMLNIGREETIDDKITQAEARLKKAKLAFFSFVGSDAQKREEQAEAQRNLDRLLNIRKVGQLQAQYAAEDKTSREAAMQFDQEGEKYLSRRAKMEEEIARARVLGQQAAVRGEDPSVTEQRIQGRIAQIRASYAELNNAGIESQIAAVTRLGAIQEEAAKRARLLLDAGQLDAGSQALDKRMEYAEKAAKLDEEALQREKSRLQQRLSLTSKETVSEDQRAAQQEKMADMRGQIALVDEQILTRRAQLTKDLTAMDVEANRVAFASLDRLLDVRQADVDALRGQVQAQKDENAAIGLSGKELQALNLKRLDEIAGIKEAAAARLAGIPGREAEAEAIRESVRLMRELNAEQFVGATKKDSVEKWKEAVKQYDDIFRQGFADMLNNGKSGWKSFTKSLTTTFKTSVADQIYKMFAQPFVVNMVGNMLGVTGGGAASVAGAAGSSLLGTAANGLGIGAALGGTLGAIGSGALQTSGALLAGHIGLFDTLGAGWAAATSGSMAGFTAGMSSLAGALGPIALGVVGLTSLYKKLDKSGTYHTGGASSASASGTQTIAAESLHFERTRVNAETNAYTAQVASSIVAILDSTATAFGKAAGFTAATAFADDSSKDGAWGGLVISNNGQKVLDWQDTRSSRWAPKEFADGEAGQKQYLEEVSKSVRTALNGIGLPDWAKQMLDGLGAAPALEDLAKAVDTINATQAALATMGQRLVGFAGLTDAAVSALMKASGGIEALATNASAYYDSFYSESEKAAVVTDQVTKALAAVGLQMPTTREGFRSLVEAQLALGEPGAKAVAALLGVAGAFASVVPAAQDAAEIARNAAAERDDLVQQLREITMSQEQLLAIQRDGIADVNKALFDQVQAAKRVASAKDVLSSAYDKEASAMQTAIEASKSWAASLRSMNDSLKLGNQSILTPEQQYAEARAQFEKTLAAASAGDTAAQGRLSATEQAFLTASQVVNASDARYAADYARVIAANEEAAKWATKQVDLQQASYDALEKQVKGLIDINDSVLTVAQAIAQLQSAMGAANGLGVQFTNAPVLPAAVATAAPVVDFTRYSAGANVGTDVIASELRAIREENKLLREEVAGLRADQAQQTGALIQTNTQANAAAAKTVVQGVEKSAKKTVEKLEFA